MNTHSPNADASSPERPGRVLVTGANGFIGSNLCRHFLAHAFEVVALVRRTSDLHFIEGLPLTLVRADLAEGAPDDLPTPLDFVLHAASRASDLMSWEEARRSIHDATVNLLRGLRRCGARPRRFVYLSSALVLGHRATGISESHPGRPARGMAPYVTAKRRTEAFLRRQSRQEGLPLVILRPSDVYGPYDRTTSLRLLQAIEEGWPAIAGSGRHILSFCGVENLAAACELACRMRGTDGEAYTVTDGQDVTWRQLMSHFQQSLGRRQRLYVPVPAAYAAALALQLVHLVVPGFRPRLTLYPVTKVGRDTVYDISRTRRELGYEPRHDLARQLDEVVRWYRAEQSAGRIRRPGRAAA